MGYHIDTGLIKEKFKESCSCPLCEIKKIVEEQFLYEFLNDAVMEENTRLKVNKLGFCKEHFEKLFVRQNKLSVALQIYTRVEEIMKNLTEPSNAKSALKQAEYLKHAQETCIICDLTEESMVKYYKTTAQLYDREDSFLETLFKSKGFCLKHYEELLRYASYAKGSAKSYVSALYSVQKRSLTSLQGELNEFCHKHDYRNALKPIGNAETSLPRMAEKLYGSKSE